MKNNSQNSVHSSSSSLKLLGLVILLLAFFTPEISAQNTKGDQPAAKQTREKKFKGRTKQKSQGIFGRRVKTRKGSATKANANYPVPNTARKTPKGGGGQVGKPLSPIIRSTPDVNERRIYPQRGRFVNNPSTKPSTDRQRERANVYKPRRIRSSTGRISNVYSQRGRFVNNKHMDPAKARRPTYSNRKQLAQLKKSQSLKQGGRPGKGKQSRVGGRSASRPFIRHRSINPFAGFWNKRRKGEKAWTGDISGRRLRTKNFQTQKPPLQPQYNAYYGKRRVGDQPYKGQSGGYRSATRSGRAWKGDISGRRIRGRNYSSKQPGDNVFLFGGLRKGRRNTGDRPYKGVIPGKGAESVSGKKKRWSPLPPKFGADKFNSFQGNIRGKAKTFRPQGEGYSGNIKSRKTFRPQGEGYSGNIKGKKTFRPQGEEYSGNIRGKKTFRPQGEEYSGNIKGKKTFRPQGEEYSGNIRGRKTFRPQGEEYSGNIRGKKTFRPQGEEYSGNIKGKKTFKPQGEEYSGNIKGRKKFLPQGEEYSGNIKARKPLKGGGTVSGKLWNNRETPIPGKTAKEEIGPFPGNYKRSNLIPVLRDQGEEFAGVNRLSRFKRNYMRNPNAVREAIKPKKEDPSTKKVDATYGKVKQYDYLHNKSSDKEALDVREPGRAFGRSVDYQGNVKMRKFDIFGKKGYHPDAQFVKTNKNNVKEERGLITNIKLLWGKLFRKSSTQPTNLKEKYHKPRYDKGEKGMWYD